MARAVAVRGGGEPRLAAGRPVCAGQFRESSNLVQPSGAVWSAMSDSGFVSADSFLSSFTETDEWRSARRRTSVAFDHAPRIFIPDSWAIEWSGSDEQRREAWEVLQLSDQELADMTAWATARFDQDFGVWSVIFELDTASQLRQRLTGREFDLWGVALAVEEFESLGPERAQEARRSATGRTPSPKRARPHCCGIVASSV